MNSYIISQRSRDTGYTLIELMIVVTLIGIISSLAYSAFTGYTRLADRAEAQADLYEIAQIMERAFTSDRDYSTIDLTDTLAAFNTASDSKYTFSASNPVAAAGAPSTYTINAVIGANSRDNFDLSIDNQGIERFRVTGTANWSATTGWDKISD